MKITRGISIQKRKPTLSDTIIGYANIQDARFSRFDLVDVITLANSNRELISIYNETPIGELNGVNATFTTTNLFEAGTVTLFLNGFFQKIIADFQTIGNNTITLTTAPEYGETILINYIKK